MATLATATLACLLPGLGADLRRHGQGLAGRRPEEWPLRHLATRRRLRGRRAVMTLPLPLPLTLTLTLTLILTRCM